MVRGAPRYHSKNSMNPNNFFTDSVYQHYNQEEEDFELYRADSFDRFCRRGSPDEGNNRQTVETPPPVEKAVEGMIKL